MNIQPDYVSFETAKLLKIKGFNIPTTHYYFEDEVFRQNSIQDIVGMDYGKDIEYELEEFYENWNNGYVIKKNGDKCFGCSKDKGYFEVFSAPEQWLVAKWLRSIHKIHITITSVSQESWMYRITKPGQKLIEGAYGEDFETYEKALEDAIFYTLNTI